MLMSSLKISKTRGSLAVQWLGSRAFTVEGVGLIPGWGNRIPQVMWPKKKKEKSQRLHEKNPFNSSHPGLAHISPQAQPSIWGNTEVFSCSQFCLNRSGLVPLFSIFLPKETHPWTADRRPCPGSGGHWLLVSLWECHIPPLSPHLK